MRRSFRDAIVGFSIIGGVVAFSFSMLWLRGIKIGSDTWSFKANFSDASGLAERSPVTYRGILVGSIGAINVTPNNVQATIEISKKDLLLPKPVFAKVVKSSLLGGDVEIALTSRGNAFDLKAPLPLPSSKDCPEKIILCQGNVIEGDPLTSISSLTSALEEILKKAGKEDIVASFVESTKQFDLTQKRLDELILQVQVEIERAEPIITELNKATAHLSNILAAIDNPKTLEDIQNTASYTSSLSQKIDEIGTDVNRMMDDEELMNAFRNVTIGLGRLFNEIYPSKTIRPLP